jgi:hypothetical protein
LDFDELDETLSTSKSVNACAGMGGDAREDGKVIVFYCALGEPSAMAVQAAPDSPPPGTLRAAWRRS